MFLPTLLSVVLKHSLSETDKHQPRQTWEEGISVEELFLSDQPEGKFVVHLKCVCVCVGTLNPLCAYNPG